MSRLVAAAALIGAWVAPNATESAVANGDTRSIPFSNDHTNESGTFTYMVNGVYDQATLDKLNWFLRDWRLDQPTKMDPHLFDIIWEVYRESGSQQPIDVLSAYRSPQTNAMLRRRSRGVAEHSQHMEGRAIDAHFMDVSPARIRDVAMRMQEGGVGFYPTGVTWVHIDSGSVRYWPRMSREALTRLFPDGKTVFIPADGKPMPGYELARAEIEQRGGQIQTQTGGGFGGLLAWLFGPRGGGADDAEESGGQEAAVDSNATAGGRGGGGRRSPIPAPTVEIAEAGPAAVAKAKRGLPTGPAYASAPEPAPEPESQPQPQVVAKLEQANVEIDSATDGDPPDTPAKLGGVAGAPFIAPLPPRRPTDISFKIAALDSVPMPPSRPLDVDFGPTAALPPARPVDLIVPNTGGSRVPVPPARPTRTVASLGDGQAFSPTLRGSDLVADVLEDRLPSVITRGLSPPPRDALALADVPTPTDDGPLLARAAGLTAPLPPMPIPDFAPAAEEASRSPVSRMASLSERVRSLFGGWF